jgi:hypothetical protein
MKKIKRFIKHLFAARWQVRLPFPQRSIQSITSAIRDSEKLHMGELRFVVEAGLEWQDLFSGINSRERALQIFSQLRVWDTEHNSGVLIYLLLADRKVEIVADRGINTRIRQVEWKSICQDMESRFRAGDFESGVLLGVAAITCLLQQQFPAQALKPNELPDHPVVL